MTICHISYINNKQKIIKLAEQWCTEYMKMKEFSRITGKIYKGYNFFALKKACHDMSSLTM